MNKLKYLAAVMIGIAGLGLQQVKACESTLNVGPNDTPGSFGTVSWTLVTNANGTQTATFIFTASGDNAGFVDSNIADLNINSSNFTVDTSATAGLTFTGSKNVNGFGVFNLTTSIGAASTQYSSITFSVTNLSSIAWVTCADVLTFNADGFDAAAHIFSTSLATTAFVGENAGGVPDGGTTVMLLGMALGALGVVRRYLTS
jgi:protein with PEP-CTERM/exosortase system signal